MPELIKLTTKTREWIVENRREIVAKFKKAISDLSEMFAWTVEQVDELISTGARFVNWMRKTYEPADKMIGWLIDLGAELGWVKAAAIILSAWLGAKLIGAVVGLIAPLTSLIALMAANPVIALALALAGAAYLIYTNWDEIVDFFRRTWARIEDIWHGTLGSLRGFVISVDVMGEDFLNAIVGWWEGVELYWAGMWANTKAAVPIRRMDRKGWPLQGQVLQGSDRLVVGHQGVVLRKVEGGNKRLPGVHSRGHWGRHGRGARSGRRGGGPVAVRARRLGGTTGAEGRGRRTVSGEPGDRHHRPPQRAARRQDGCARRQRHRP